MAPKQKPNAFMAFVMDYKQKPNKRGLSVPEAVAECGPIWENMNAGERAPFIAMSKKPRAEKPRGKLDCIGRPLSHVQLEQEEKEQRQRQIKLNIEQTVKNSVRSGLLTEKNYFFIMFNYFIKNRENVYVPAELGIAQYSLKEGLHCKYHAFINPGVDIFGHQYEAQIHANETHLLPLPPNAKGDRNLGKVYNEIVEFIRDKKTGELQPVYTLNKSMAEVTSCLDFLQADVAAGETCLEVYPIQYLFYVLKEATCKMGEQEKPSSIYVTDAYFERDFFDYEDGIACHFHEEKDRGKYCALSFVTRWGFMFSDYMCGDIAIIPKPGYHLPHKSAASYKTIMPKAAVSHTTPKNNKDEMWEQRWNNNAPSTASESLTSADFPALGAKSKKTNYTGSITNTSYANLLRGHVSSTFNDTVDVIDDANNPWAARSRRAKPNAPDSKVFDMDFDECASYAHSGAVGGGDDNHLAIGDCYSLADSGHGDEWATGPLNSQANSRPRGRGLWMFKK